MTAPKKAADYHRTANIESARLILTNESKYGGPDSLVCQWATLILERTKATIDGPLFRESRAA